MPIALAAGTFISAVGFLSIPMAILLFISQIAFLMIFGCTSAKKLGVDRLRLNVARVTSGLAFVLLSIWIVSQTAVGASAIGTLIVTNIAFEEDMLDEKVCTGVDSTRRIVYFDGDQTRAFVFWDPSTTTSPSERSRPVRVLKSVEIERRIPLYLGVIDCHYHPFSPMRMLTR